MFDIDKLGLSWLNYQRKDGVLTSDFEEGTEKYYQNQIIKDYITLLTDPKTAHILYRSIDKDTKLLKDIVKEIEYKQQDIERPYKFYSLSTQTSRKDDYITGKIGIGSFALNNNNHILTMLYGVKFKHIRGSIMSTLGLENLDTREDVDGNSIMSWISALINAHVDIAKDPFISKLNVNRFTYNLVNTLVRTGFGKNTFYFTTQPIMKDLADAYNNAAGLYMADPNKTVYTLQKEAMEEVAKTHFEKEVLPFVTGKFDDLVDEVMQSGSIQSDINTAFKEIVDTGTLEKYAGKSDYSGPSTSITVNGKTYNLTANQIQYIVYLANLQFAPYAQTVSNLVKYSKIDTKKHGKSIIEQQLYLEGFRDLFYPQQNSGLLEEVGLRRMAMDSYIHTKTVNAISMTKSILSDQFVQSTQGFLDSMSKVLSDIGRQGSRDLKLNNKIAQILMAAIKSEIINDYAKRLRPNNPTYIRDLVSESREENIPFELPQGSFEISLGSQLKYKPSSYIGGRVAIQIPTTPNDKLGIGTTLGGGGIVVDINKGDEEWVVTIEYPVVGANDENNTIIIPAKRNKDTNSTIKYITGGKNTIYDRFNRLSIELQNDPAYQDVLDGAGEPINMLLKSLVPGETFNYTASDIEAGSPDTYPTLKFVKLFNALDNNGSESNFIIDAWDELLHDNKHPKLKEFAEDLVVYAFVTSGDKQGFTKFFKQVPLSWRKESGYASEIQDRLLQYKGEQLSQEMIDDTILNNWFDNDIVPTFYLIDKEKRPNFVSYSGEYRSQGHYVPRFTYPMLLAAVKKNEKGVFEPSIDPNNSPLYIKVPRKRAAAAKDSQRRYTVFRRVDYGMKQTGDGEWITYPIYAKVNPKGNELPGGFTMTEYGRSDAITVGRTPDLEKVRGFYKIGDFLSRQSIENFKSRFGDNYSQIIESMNYYSVFINTYNSNFNKFNAAVRSLTSEQEPLLSEEKPDVVKLNNDTKYTPTEGELFTGKEHSEAEALIYDAEFNDEDEFPTDAMNHCKH